MEVVSLETNIKWLPLPNEVALILDKEMPPAHLVTSALAIAFDGQRLLLTNLRQRGWDIPGGHVEPGEIPEQTMQREVLEESGVLLKEIRLLGYQRIRLLGKVPAGYRYPHPDSYQVLYLGKVAVLYDFSATTEASERAFFAPNEVQNLRWVQENRLMYEAAMHIVISECWQSLLHK